LLRILGRGILLRRVAVGRVWLIVGLLLHHHLLLLDHHLLLLLHLKNCRIGRNEPVDEHAQSDDHQRNAYDAQDDRPGQYQAYYAYDDTSDYVSSTHFITTALVMQLSTPYCPSGTESLGVMYLYFSI
jgi:hypothetical protein